MMQALLPKSYEELVGNPELSEFAKESGWFKPNQKIAVLPDGNGTPVLYQPGQSPKTPCEWEENTPIEQLLGDTKAETETILKNLEFETYQH